jgi:Xaa-Pro aminopeptidase
MSGRSSNKNQTACASRRRAALRRAAARKAQALLVSRPVDVRYLSGFTGEDSFLLAGRRWAVLITDGRFDEQAPRECPGIEIHVRKGSMSEAIKDALKGRTVRTLGVQGTHLTAAAMEDLARAAPSRRLKPLRDLVAPLRMVKDDSEVRAVRRAVRVAERAFGELIVRGIRAFVGRSEREVAAELEYRMRLAGAEAPAFETVVAAGAHGSFPHYRPGATRIRRGQAVLIDWGARLAGYCSDLTRVLFTGRIPPKLGAVYEVVRRAQAAGIAAVRAGVACKTPDAAARRVIDDAGYGRRFVHGLGHGLGLEVHEPPALAARSRARLHAGMVVTVEPGIYLPGAGGVRIEDDILVTTDGRRRLSSLSTDIRAMVLR